MTPSFKGVPVTVAGALVDGDVDFEVLCAACGAGLCDRSATRLSRRRRWPQVVVEPCPACLRRARAADAPRGKPSRRRVGLLAAEERWVRERGGFSYFWATATLARAHRVTEAVASGRLVVRPGQFPWADAKLKGRRR